MREKILVVEDDFGTQKMIETILKKNEYRPVCFSSPVEALKTFHIEDFDVILSDFYMPDMNGDKFLVEVRKENKYIPFIILTVNKDVQNAINLLKEGADDYINKPVEKEELIFRIGKNVSEKKNKRDIDRIDKEKAIMELETKRLVNWKALYAAKDVKQTEQVINLFTRTVNQDGSFIWLDLLKGQLEKLDDKFYKVKKSLIDLIIKSSERNQSFFDNIAFLSNLDSFDMNFEYFTFSELTELIYKYVEEDLAYLKEKYNRNFVVQKSNHKINGKIKIDVLYFQKIIKEILINAIKYSPDKTDIFILPEKDIDSDGKYITLSVKNTPRLMNAKNLEGEQITGIPYEYSELVFDLFYTIEAFPNPFDEEEWANGTGLFIVRKILKKFDGWIKSANGIDYTKGDPIPYIKFSINLPCK